MKKRVHRDASIGMRPLNDGVIPPWSAQIEITSGCNLRCEFCFLRNMPWPRDYFHHMSPDKAEHAASEISMLNDHIRIEIAMRGEPLLNPRVAECVASIRVGSPKSQLQLTSNGTRLLRRDGIHMIGSLFEAGLNILLLDCYSPYGDRLRSFVMGKVMATYKGASIHTYGEDKFSPWSNHGRTGKHIVLMPDIVSLNGIVDTRTITNQGGNSKVFPPLEKPLKKMCPVPWREIAVQSNGDVPICCDDAGCEYKLGNIFESSAVEIWNGDIAKSARRMLRYRHRWFNPCCRCNGPSPARNRAIPFCVKPTAKNAITAYTNIHKSPRHNGVSIEWVGPKLLGVENECNNTN